MGGVIFLVMHMLTLSFYTNTHPDPFLEASLYTEYAFPSTGKVRIGALVGLFFKAWKASSHLLDHSNLVTFLASW